MKVQYSLSAFLVSSMFLFGCNAAEDTTREAAHATEGAAKSAGDFTRDIADDISDSFDQGRDDVRDWINSEPLAQRETKCAEESGEWTPRVSVAPCVNGETEISLESVEGNVDVQRQECGGGDGADFEWQCVHRDAQDRIYFNDGPSVPHVLQKVSTEMDDSLDQMRWNDIFWLAAVNHDYCYHHNGSQYDLQKNDCDQQFFLDLTAVCLQDSLKDKHDWFAEDSCKREAAAVYEAVRDAGEESWATMDTAVAYPEWVPLWERFGMPEAPSLQTLGKMVGGEVGVASEK